MSFCALPQADQIRLQRIAEHVTTLGPRAVAEALADALAHGDLGRLESFRRLQVGMVEMLVGDAFPPAALTVPADLLPSPNPEDQHEGGDGREVA